MTQSTEIATASGTNALALGTTTGNRFAGMDSSDLVLPVAHLFQGLPLEVKQYGKHDQGEVIHSLTMEPVASSLFVPISAYKEWVKWKEPRGTGLEYAKRNRSEVPPEDLERFGDEQPAACEYHNWVVLFEGEDGPCVIRCKSSSLKASKTLFTLEKMRAAKGPGLYEFAFRERSNDQGAWIVPDFKAKGNPPPELLARATEFYTAMAGQTITTAEEATGFDPDAD